MTDHVQEIMRLAGLMATARCVRLRQKEKGPVQAAQAELRVAKATEALRAYVQEQLLRAQEATTAAEVIGEVMLADCRRQCTKQLDQLKGKQP